MNSHQNSHAKQSFHCPLCQESASSHDHFCTPFNCPEKIPTTLFSSPNSSFPQEELNQLKECIEAANNLLLVLGSPRSPDNTRKLQLHFLSLRQKLMNVQVQCNEGNEEMLGQLETAGKNFIQLKGIGKTIFILYERICHIEHNSTNESQGHMHALSDINPCTRRELVLNFGPFVAKKPELANLFFGIPLHLQLLSFIGCQIFIKTEDEGEPISGILVDTDEGSIKIMANEEIKRINFNKICMISTTA